jgi:hypothetical protein
MTVEIGKRLGPYEILAPLGAGGMGEVYKAHDSRLGRDVAIKVLPAQFADDPEALARFEREARAVAALNHPNILALHDIGSENGIAHAVMELLEGETLRKRLASGPPSPRKAIEWATQIALGLAAAHDRGIVHRDLKPDNVFVTRDGHIKLLDFGLALKPESAWGEGGDLITQARTEPGVFVGTPAYASPEQILGEPATARSDMFALGVVAYEMLTGSNPFRRQTMTGTLTAILRDNPPPLASSVQGVSLSAIRLIERCVEKQPAERPASARDVAFFLDASTEAPADIAPGVAISEARASARRIRHRVLAVACGLLLAVVATTWGFVNTMADRAVGAALESDLAQSQAFVTHVHAERLDRLRLTARLLASFPELKALFARTDAATIRDFLLTYQQQNPGTPVLAALGPTGTVLGRTDTTGISPSDADEWLKAVAKDGEPTVVFVGGRPYHAAGAQCDAGGSIFGYVVAAAPVDSEFAQAIEEVTGDEAIILSSKALLASTLPGSPPWKTLEDWRSQGGRPDKTMTAAIGARRFAAREVPLAQDPAVSAIIARSRDDAIEPFRRIQNGLVGIGLIAAFAAVLASVWLSTQIRQSIRSG